MERRLSAKEHKRFDSVEGLHFRGISLKVEQVIYTDHTRERYLHPLPIFSAVSTMVVRQAYTLEGPD